MSKKTSSGRRLLIAGLAALALSSADTALWKSSRVAENDSIELKSRDDIETQLESAISAEKPADVSAIIYDNSQGRVYAAMAARDFAAAEAHNYGKRFNEPAIVREIAGLLRGRGMYKNYPEQASKGVSSRLQSQFGRERLAALIQDQLYITLLEHIREDNAVAIKNPLGRYNIYVFSPMPSNPSDMKGVIMDAYTRR